MKNAYLTPEFQIFSLSSRDVIAASDEKVSDIGGGDQGVEAALIFG